MLCNLFCGCVCRRVGVEIEVGISGAELWLAVQGVRERGEGGELYVRVFE